MTRETDIQCRPAAKSYFDFGRGYGKALTVA